MPALHRFAWTALFALAFAAPAVAWQLPLVVEEYGVAAGLRHVTGGVPLLAGQAAETSELTLAAQDAAGRLTPVPAQFRVLARWWRADNSIRWVLVDFAADLGKGEKAAFVLTNEKLPAAAPADKLAATQTADAITVTTGPARFVIGRKSYRFLDSVRIDADGDGKFADAEELLATDAGCGTVVEDTFGQKYPGDAGTKSVEVIESGPMRVRVRARGVHVAPAGAGYSRGMYQYDVMMDFYPGSTQVVCDVILGNNFAQSIGSPTFEDASLWLKLAGPATQYSIAGNKGAPVTGELGAGESVCLYQDSNGADTWKECQGYNTEQRDYWRFPADKTCSFRGYKVWQRGKGEKEIAAGDQATGTTVLATARGGVVVHMRNFWQQFPKGMEVFADGRLRVAMFPREYRVPHFLEDASAKGHEIALQFFAAAKLPDAAKLAAVWEEKVLPRPTSLEHIAACGALADLGPFTVPTAGLDSKPNNRTAAYDPRMLTDDGLYGNAYGWQIFGEKWRSCGGHSTRGARQPMNEDDYLNRWLVTANRGWLLNGDARSRQFRDVRCYRIEDVDPFSYKNWDDFRSHNRSEDWTSRPQPKDAEATKYSQGRYARSTFWLPNPAHMVLDLPYDRYLLMGDPRSFENLRIIAAHGGYYAAYYKAEVHRASGWCWRTLFRYWELTGDKDAEAMLKRVAEHFKEMVDGDFSLAMKSADEVNWWFTFVFSRGAAMAALYTADPNALTVCKRLSEKIDQVRQTAKGYYYGDYAELHAVLWHLTGEEKYKTEGLGPDGGEKLKSISGGMKSPACAHWLLVRPPAKGAQ